MESDYKLEYHEGYYAAGNDISFDESWSDSKKEGYRDGKRALLTAPGMARGGRQKSEFSSVCG